LQRKKQEQERDKNESAAPDRQGSRGNRVVYVHHFPVYFEPARVKFTTIYSVSLPTNLSDRLNVHGLAADSVCLPRGGAV
jgi:hypothetical protein